MENKNREWDANSISSGTRSFLSPLLIPWTGAMWAREVRVAEPLLVPRSSVVLVSLYRKVVFLISPADASCAIWSPTYSTY